MAKKPNEDKFIDRIKAIEGFYQQQRRMPTYSEIGDICGFKSKNAVFKLVEKLKERNLLEKLSKQPHNLFPL